LAGEDDSITIVIPAYNEEIRIRETILRYSEEFPDQEIIVVCDGVDNTKKLVGEVAGERPNIHLLEFHRRLGKGGAIVKGLKAAKGDMVGFVDADESVNPEDIRGMFKALNDVDAVIASRRLKESKILKQQPIVRRTASKIFNIAIRAVFDLPFRDTQCGAKVFKGQAIRDILGDLETDGFEIDVEILWRLKKKGYKVIEYPIKWRHSEDSKFKLSHSIDMMHSLLRVRLK